jgi:hypothetical protein
MKEEALKLIGSLFITMPLFLAPITVEWDMFLCMWMSIYFAFMTLERHKIK